MKTMVHSVGLGTRFLPATKAIPKEMLPIVDKPTIQYIVEEAFRAGIEKIVMVGRHKVALKIILIMLAELEVTLDRRGKRIC